MFSVLLSIKGENLLGGHSFNLMNSIWVGNAVTVPPQPKTLHYHCEEHDADVAAEKQPMVGSVNWREDFVNCVRIKSTL